MSAPASRYAVGQLWRCKGRTPDESPTLLINQIDQHPLGGEIYHVTLRDVRVRQPALPSGWIDSLPHAPVIAQTFERSDAVLIGTDTPDPAYREGYAQWKAAFDAGNAGSFGVSVATILEIVERQLNGQPLR